MEKLYIIRETRTMSKEILDDIGFEKRAEALKYLRNHIREHYSMRMEHFGTTVSYHAAEDFEISSIKLLIKK